MSIHSDFTFDQTKEQEPEDHRFGITIVMDQFFLGGEEDVCQILSEVDVWIDLRHENAFNRIVHVPGNVTYVRIPVKDGDAQRARHVFQKAKQLISASLSAKERVVVSCNAGVSRSLVVAWWVLAEELGDADRAWRILKQRRPHIEPDETFFPFIQEHILIHKSNNC